MPKSIGPGMVLVSVHLPREWGGAIDELVKAGYYGSRSDVVRCALYHYVLGGAYLQHPPPPLRRDRETVTFSLHLPQKLLERVDEAVRELALLGIRATRSDVVRGAVYLLLRATGNVREEVAGGETGGEGQLIEGRPRGAPPPSESNNATSPPATPRLPPREGVVIIPYEEAKWGEGEWARVAPCAQLYITSRGERFYLVDIECARGRGVEL